MNNFSGQMDINNGYQFDESYNNRTFQNLDSLISGKSVVIESDISQENSHASAQDMWPYSLNDYLKFFVGKTVQIEYVLPNGRSCIKRGELKVTGLNFVGIQVFQKNDLFLIEFNAIKSISIINYKANTRKHIY